jgi:alcohol dehydrogenase (cytochrome c)
MEVWRFWTVPKPGEPGSDTWQGTGPADHRGASTWFTGSYDPALDLVLLARRQSEPRVQRRRPRRRQSLCELHPGPGPTTGRLKWHYQFTPHDLWDWDATQTSVLIDADWQGRPRQLMLHASRNGLLLCVRPRRRHAAARDAVHVTSRTRSPGAAAGGRGVGGPDLQIIEPFPEYPRPESRRR